MPTIEAEPKQMVPHRYKRVTLKIINNYNIINVLLLLQVSVYF